MSNFAPDVRDYCRFQANLSFCSENMKPNINSVNIIAGILLLIAGGRSIHLYYQNVQHDLITICFLMLGGIYLVFLGFYPREK
jgi:hypothetical protein